MTIQEKHERVRKALDPIIKKGMDGRVGLASELLKPLERIRTGCLAVDRAIGGGFPRGIVSEIMGDAGTGKTTMAMQVVANAQRLYPDSLQVVISAEGKMSPYTFELTKADPDRVVIFYPMDYGEQALNALKLVLKELRDDVSVIVIDSVASLAPYVEMVEDEKDGLEGQTVGAHARQMSTFLRRYVGSGLLDSAATILINQLRQQVSTVPLPPTSTGGRAMTYYPKIRIKLTTSSSRRVRKSEVEAMQVLPGMPDWSLLGKDDAVGHDVDFEVVKDNIGVSVSDPLVQKKGTFRIIYQFGYDNFATAIGIAVAKGIVSQRGAYYQYGDVKVQGLYAFIKELIVNGLWQEVVERLE